MKMTDELNSLVGSAKDPAEAVRPAATRPTQPNPTNDAKATSPPQPGSRATRPVIEKPKLHRPAKLEFSVPYDHHIVIRVIDPNSGEVIRTIPPLADRMERRAK